VASDIQRRESYRVTCLKKTRNKRKYAFLNLRNLPPLLTRQQAGWLLGFSARQVTTLIKAKLLHPLPSFSRSVIRLDLKTVNRLAMNKRWIDDATDAVERARSINRR
jgi:hypothetical protein